MKYNDFSSGQVEAVFNKLGGAEGVMEFLSGKTMVTKVLSGKPVVTKFLSDNTIVTKVLSDGKPSSNVWKTIKLGTHKDVDALCIALKKADFRIGLWGGEILGNPAFAVLSVEEEIQLVNLSKSELGVKDNATYGEICSKAKEFGLELCPNEVGPQLRLQYKDQPKYDYIYVAMEPITASGDRPSIFIVVNDVNGLGLNATRGGSASFFSADCRFVFILRK